MSAAPADAADESPRAEDTAAPVDESRLKRLLRGAAQYSAGSIVTMAASISRVGVTARVLDSTEVGIWLGLQVLLGYAGNLHLGSLYGAYRSVPMLRAAGDDAGAEREKETSFGFVLVMMVVGMLGVLVLAPRVSQASKARHIVLTMVLLGANLLRMYWSTILRAESRFKTVSVAWVVGAVVTVATLPLIYLWGLEGVLVGMLAQTLAEVACLAKGLGIPRPRIVTPVLKAQLRVGVMTLGTTVGTLALTTADRTIMLRLCGVEEAGHYYIGANIITIIPMVALIPATVLTPQFFERAGAGEDLLPLVTRPLKLMAVFVALLCGGAAAILPAVVVRVWPNHLPGLSAAMVALLSTCPIVLAGLTTNVFYALDRQFRHVVILGITAGCAYLFGGIGVYLTHGSIAGAIGGAALAMLAYYVVVTLSAMRLVPSQTKMGAVKMVFASIFPTCLVALALTLFAVVVPDWMRGDIASGALAIGVTLLGSLPFVPRAISAFRSGGGG